MRRQFESFTPLRFVLYTFWISLSRGGMVCPAGWNQHAQSCYAILTRPATWSEAVNLCRGFGGELALPLTLEENDFIWNLFRAQNLTDITPNAGGVWMGCRRTAPNGTWECAKNRTLLFARWKDGQPDGAGDCMVMWHHTAKWADVNCGKTRFTVCERRLMDCPRRSRCVQVASAVQRSICPSSHIFKEVPVRGPMHCCMLCTNEPLCRSFNLRENICQLNIDKSADVAPSEDLVLGTICAYYEMNYM